MDHGSALRYPMRTNRRKGAIATDPQLSKTDRNQTADTVHSFSAPLDVHPAKLSLGSGFAPALRENTIYKRLQFCRVFLGGEKFGGQLAP